MGPRWPPGQGAYHLAIAIERAASAAQRTWEGHDKAVPGLLAMGACICACNKSRGARDVRGHVGTRTRAQVTAISIFFRESGSAGTLLDTFVLLSSTQVLGCSHMF